MEITHYANSFIEIYENDTYLLCDPWISTANHGAWHVVPDIPEVQAIQTVSRATYIYISHLHSDHLCTELLKKCNLEEKTFIISKFKIQTLKKEIEALNPARILELTPWTKYQLENLSVAIVPQLASSTSPKETDINYDLDTSILVQSRRDKIVFFNKVDNPLPLTSLSRVMEFSIDAFGSKPEIATFNVGAAGEYPQCFLGLDRDAERNRIIEQSLKSFEKEISIISPSFAFPAGGLYSLAGNRVALNKWLAIPESSKIIESARTASPKTTTIDLLGGGSIQTQIDEPRISASKGSWKLPDSNLLSSVSFDYESMAFSEYDQTCSFQEKLEEALNSYQNMCAQFAPKLDWSIKINLYHNFSISDSGEIRNSEVNHVVNLKDFDSNKSITLHIDCRAFVGAINRRFSWNQLISGSHAMIERQPNIYDPDALFSLNFFRV